MLMLASEAARCELHRPPLCRNARLSLVSSGVGGSLLLRMRFAEAHVTRHVLVPCGLSCGLYWFIHMPYIRFRRLAVCQAYTPGWFSPGSYLPHRWVCCVLLRTPHTQLSTATDHSV